MERSSKIQADKSHKKKTRKNFYELAEPSEPRKKNRRVFVLILIGFIVMVTVFVVLKLVWPKSCS